MLICRVESDIFGNRAAVLVPGHCRTCVPFFFLSFIIMIGPINLALAVIPPILACKPGSCHPQGLPHQSPGSAWVQDRPGQWVREPGLMSHQSARGLSLSWKMLLEEEALAGVLWGWGPGQLLLCANWPVGIWDMTTRPPQSLP